MLLLTAIQLSCVGGDPKVSGPVAGDVSADVAAIKGDQSAIKQSFAAQVAEVSALRADMNLSAKLDAVLNNQITLEATALRLDAKLTNVLQINSTRTVVNSPWPIVWLVLGWTGLMVLGFLGYLLGHRLPRVRAALDAIKGKECNHEH